MCHPTGPPPADIPFWRPSDAVSGLAGTNSPIYRPDVYRIIEKRIEELDQELRALSLDIHGMFLAQIRLVIA